MGRHMVNRNTRREGGSKAPPDHEALDLLGEVPQESSFVDELDRAFAGLSGHFAGVEERIAHVRIHSATPPTEPFLAARPGLASRTGRRPTTHRPGAWVLHRHTGPLRPQVVRGRPRTSGERVGHDDSRWSM